MSSLSYNDVFYLLPSCIPLPTGCQLEAHKNPSSNTYILRIHPVPEPGGTSRPALEASTHTHIHTALEASTHTHTHTALEASTHTHTHHTRGKYTHTHTPH